MAHRYQPVGRCIYCGAADNLSTEHIIPFALGGDFTLPDSSCDACAKLINSEIETPILHQEMKAFRTFQNLPTRRPGKRPKTYALRNRDGTVVRVPAREYYGPFPLYKFEQPRALTGAAPSPNDHAWGMAVFGMNRKAEVALRARYPEWDGSHQLTPRPYRFARLLAKISYGYAAAEFGLNAFLPGDVTDIVLGRTEDVFRCVGGTDPEPHPGPEEEPPGHWFRIEVHCRQRGVGLVAQVVVRIRLFAKYHVPTYTVVAGEVDFRNPRHFEALEERRRNGRMVLSRQGVDSQGRYVT